MLKKWKDLPDYMQNDAVRKYYDILYQKRGSLFLKRVFDIVVSFIMLVLLSPVFLILAIVIKCDSPGPVFFRQTRITQYGKTFRIFKFRTMVDNAEKLGTQITSKDDIRITRIGHVIRKYRLDEICQLIDIFRGKMSFVGTRPEVPKFVDHYTEEMMATLLLPAGVTSEASIYYKDEDRILESVEDMDKAYIENVLPDKMYYNLKSIENFSFFYEIFIMLKTIWAIFSKEDIKDKKNF